MPDVDASVLWVGPLSGPGGGAGVLGLEALADVLAAYAAKRKEVLRQCADIIRVEYPNVDSLFESYSMPKLC